MTKKLIKHGNSRAIVIDKPILEMLNFTDSTDLKLSIVDGRLIIESEGKSPFKKDIKAIVREVMEEYSSTLEKLSKT